MKANQNYRRERSGKSVLWSRRKVFRCGTHLEFSKVLDTGNVDGNHSDQEDRDVDGKMVVVLIPVLNDNGGGDDFDGRRDGGLEPELPSDCETDGRVDVACRELDETAGA